MSAQAKADGLGLQAIGNLSGLLKTDAAGGAALLELALSLIDEDPNQPRQESNPGFSKSSLKELAITIQQRGVKTPISVRSNPDSSGRYIINHGARRFRAARMAKKDTIPAFVDNDYLEADQVIENLQRNALTAREIADFIGRELAKGMKKSSIARAIGKSNAFVSQHVTLLDLPEPIANVYKSGRASDVTVINELVKLYKKHPEEVIAWIEDELQELTRSSVKLIREQLEDELNAAPTIGTDAVTAGNEEKPATEPAEEKKVAKKQDPNKLVKAIIVIRHNDRPGRLLLHKRPTTEGLAWIKYDDDGQEIETDLAELDLVALIDGT